MVALAVRLFHADKSHPDHALYQALRRQVLPMPDAKAQNWYEKDAETAPTLHPANSGFMNLGDVELPEEAQVFMCGSLPFMQAARKSLTEQGVPSENVQDEVFRPDLWAQQPQ